MRKKRVMSLILSVIVCIAMMPMAVFADVTGGGTAATVTYIDADGQVNTVNSETVTNISSDSYTLNSGWYIATGDVTIDANVKVNGDVNLILADDAKLTINEGISGSSSNLTIYTGNATNASIKGNGKLIAKGKAKEDRSSTVYGNAAIDASNGILTINGGNIEATGGNTNNPDATGTYTNISGGTGILAKDITINGGTVTATGGDAFLTVSSGDGLAQAGGGISTSNTIIVNGGKVTAIGGKANSNNTTVGGDGIYAAADFKMNNGEVIATGGDFNANGAGGAGIHAYNEVNVLRGTITALGGSFNGENIYFGMGGNGISVIGNTVGNKLEGGRLLIAGGNITATGGDSAVAGSGIYVSCYSEIKGGSIKGVGGCKNPENGIPGGYGIDFSIATGATHKIVGGIIDAIGQDGRDGIGGSFTTGTDGNAVIFVNNAEFPGIFKTGIEQGVVFIGDEGDIYGNPTILDDTIIPADKKLTISSGKKLNIAKGKTLSNQGTIIIANEGKLENNGTIINNGKIINNNTGKDDISISNNGVIAGDGTVDVKVSNTGIQIINVDGFDFGKAAKGYSSVAAQTLFEKGTNDYDAEILTNTESDFELKSTDKALQISPKQGLDVGEYSETLTIKITKNSEEVMTLERKVKFEVTVASGGGHYEPVQKPEIVAGEGGDVKLENNGTTLVISPKEGMKISKVTVNGVEVRVDGNKVTGLKTGDEVVVTFKEIMTPNIVKGYIKGLKVTVRSSKTSKGNIRIKVTSLTDSDGNPADFNQLNDEGYIVKYKYYRSTQKASKYTAKVEKDADINSYINTSGKKGTRYYYKVRVMVYDADGNLVAKSDLKQCSYAARTWNK